MAKVKIRHKKYRNEDYQIPGSPTLVHFDGDGVAEMDEALYGAHFRNSFEYQVVTAEHQSEPAPATSPYRAPTAKPKEVKATKEEIAQDEADKARKAANADPTAGDVGEPIHVVIDEEEKPAKPKKASKAAKTAKKATKPAAKKTAVTSEPSGHDIHA